MSFMRLPDTAKLKTDMNQADTDPAAIYNVDLKRLNGQPLDLNDFRGKYILFVNVASKCGFTGQYKSLQELSEAYAEDLVIIGLPCNQFGKQEPGTASEIQEFCELNYGVTFPITEKLDVKGKDQHLVYQWLTQKRLNGKKNSTVRWNFQKYLVGPEGELIDVFYSITSPGSKKITKHFAS